MTNMTQVHNTENWTSHYANRVGESYPSYCRQQYQPFLQVLRDALRYYESLSGEVVIREEGCGIGTITKILAQDSTDEIKFLAFDFDKGQVALTKENMKSVRSTVEIVEGNIFENQTGVDIIHSHGVLEHFSDEEISKVLSRQKKQSHLVVHYVPLDGWAK